MSHSSYFRELRSAYQAEIDDLTYDSDGGNVLRQRLAAQRKEIDFLLKMMTLSPEMVAVVFHQGFTFNLPAAMDNLLAHESDELPEWDSVAQAIQLAPWAQVLAARVLKEPMGEWFMTVAAGLEYMYHKADPSLASEHASDEEEDDEEDRDNGAGDERFSEFDADDDRNKEGDARAREEAGADWMVEQGFDRKD
jgi:hypothetical protein